MLALQKPDLCPAFLLISNVNGNCTYKKNCHLFKKATGIHPVIFQEKKKKQNVECVKEKLL